MAEIKDKLITAENLKNAYDDNKRQITELKDKIGNLVSKKQGTENSGKALIVDENGNVICGEAGVSADATLSEEGKAADAKATGDAISELKSDLANFENEICNKKDVFNPVSDVTWVDGKIKAYAPWDRFTDVDGWAYAEFTVNDGEAFDISGWAYYAFLLYVFVADDHSVTRFPETNPSGYAEVSNTFIAKTSGKLYVNRCYSKTIPYIKKSETVVDGIKPTMIGNGLKGIKWGIIGDSLSAESTLGVGVDTYHDYIAKKYGITQYNHAIGGQGYMTGSNNFIVQSENIESDCDLVTIFGSFNDWGNANKHWGTVGDETSETLCGCVNTVISNVKNRCPNAKILIILPTPWKQFCWKNGTEYFRATSLYNFLNAIKDTAQKVHGVPVLDLYHNSQLRPWESDFKEEYYLNADGVHPNTLGHKKYIAPSVENKVISMFNEY